MTTELTDRQLIERHVGALTSQGWRVVSQTETSVQMAEPKQWSQAGLILFVALPLLGGLLWAPLFGFAIFGLLIVLADYLLKKEQLSYVTADQLRRQPSADADVRGIQL